MPHGRSFELRGRATPFVIVAILLWALVPRFRADTAVQDALATPLGLLVSLVLAAATIGTLILWNWPVDRRPFLWAILVTTALDTLLLVLAEREHWLGGTVVRPSTFLLVTIYGAAFVAFTAVPLGVYRRIAAASPRAAVAVYLVIVIALSAASVPVLEDWLQRGIYVFDRGYSIAWDVTWGAVQWLFALGLYEVLRNRQGGREIRPAERSDRG
jgi:hypothetical protein